MRISLKHILIASFAVALFSCKKDNYAPPDLTLTGNLLYKGDSIYLERNAVHIQTYQYGFGRVGPIDQTFSQSGTYSSELFAGDYKLTVPNGDGPFLWPQKTPGVPDSVSVSLNSNQTVNFEVTPYYMIRTPQVTAAGADSVHTTFKIEKVITDANAKDIDYVALYVNSTQFVAGSNNIASSSVAGSAITDMNNVNLGVKFSAIVPTQNYVFARVGLKITNVEDLIFSPLFKIQF